jgi:hypothetical protein
MGNEVVVKTAKPDNAPAGTTSAVKDPGPGTNVLHNFRSYTYIFTLASLSPEEVKNPDAYRVGAKLKKIVLRSGGKADSIVTSESQFNQNDPEIRRTESLAPNKVKSLIDEFNQKSPGRFDMFIDNLEIETIMARDKNSASTLPTSISFDVFEPYSINGFMEALQVAAQAAGYPDYRSAVFVIKMEFIGYPDGDDMPEPMLVPKSVRYFTIKMTGVEVNVDEKGTKYAVKAVPSNEISFGNPSDLKKPVKISGRTVKDILTSLVDGKTAQVKKEDEDSEEKPADHDEYKVKFPTWDNAKGWIDTDNIIATAKVTEITEDKNLFKMPDPGETSKSSSKYGVTSKTNTPAANGKKLVSVEPGNPVVQFNEGRSIQECIEAIVRDSHYLRERLEKLMGSEWKSVVNDNMFDYFLIRLEVTEKNTIDKRKNRHFCIYTYVVTPHKMLFTKVPGFANQTIDQSTLYKACIRRYNYIYTGKNIDITSFKLNFNNLYFEARPVAYGNPESPPARDTVSKTDSTNYKSLGKEGTKTNDTKKDVPNTTTQSSADQTPQDQRSGGQPQRSPYYSMAQSLHQAIINGTSMLTGDIDILGDPMYLVTGGIGNYNPKPSDSTPRIAGEGEATFNYGDVLININFKNPIDIGEDGLMYFDSNLIPFSGVYQVTKCVSRFKDGAFKQSLSIIRMPGQAVPTEDPANTPQSQKTPPTNPQDSGKQVPNPDDQTTEDTSPTTAERAGFRPDQFSLAAQLGRTLPDPGLPGQASNFAAATGGLGGVVPMTPASGINPNLPGVARFISNLGVQNQPAFSIPLPARVAAELQQQVYSPGGFLQQMGDNLMKTFGISGAPKQLIDQVLRQQANKINRIPIPGSGIGVGATVQIVKNNPNPLSVADLNLQQLPESPTATPSVPGVSGNALGYLTNNLTAIPGVINNAALKLQSVTQGTSADPLAIAAAYGINQAQLSGLSPNITSKLINQLKNIIDKIPENTDINTLVRNGVNFNGLSQSDVAALPPSTPYATAPQPSQDIGFLRKIAGAAGLSGMARSFGVNSIDQVSQTQLPSDIAQSAVSNIPSVIGDYASKLGVGGVNAPQDAAVQGLKLYAERNSLMNPTGILGSLEGNFIGVRNQLGPVNVVGNLGSSAPSLFGSKTVGSSPLDKIMIR